MFFKRPFHSSPPVRGGNKRKDVIERRDFEELKLFSNMAPHEESPFSCRLKREI